MPGVWAAVLLGGALAAAGAWLLARRPLAQTWPALVLLAYVVQPEVRPDVWRWTLFVTLAAFSLNWWAGRGIARTDISSRQIVWLTGGVLFVGFLVLYVNTLAPDVLAADSGELQGWAANFDRQRLQGIFLVHGEKESALGLSGLLHQEGFRSVEIPERGQSFPL